MNVEIKKEQLILAGAVLSAGGLAVSTYYLGKARVRSEMKKKSIEAEKYLDRIQAAAVASDTSEAKS